MIALAREVGPWKTAGAVALVLVWLFFAATGETAESWCREAMADGTAPTEAWAGFDDYDSCLTWYAEGEAATR